MTKRATKAEKERWERIITQLCKANGITIEDKRSTGATGRATRGKKVKRIKIPEPTSLAKFCVCLHEIGHVVKDKKSYPKWKSEYIACTYEEEMLEKLGIAMPQEEKLRNKNYVLMYIIKGLRRSLRLDSVDQKVLDYAEVDVPRWKTFLAMGYKPYLKAHKTWADCQIVWDSKETTFTFCSEVRRPNGGGFVSHLTKEQVLGYKQQHELNKKDIFKAFKSFDIL